MLSKTCLRSRAGSKTPCMPLLPITIFFHGPGRVAPIRSRSIKPRTTVPISVESWRRSKTGRARMICRKNSDLKVGSRTPMRNSGGKKPATTITRELCLSVLIKMHPSERFKGTHDTRRSTVAEFSGQLSVLRLGLPETLRNRQRRPAAAFGGIG